MTTTRDLHAFTVTPEEGGARLDVLVARRVDGLSRRRAAQLAQLGQLRVNGQRARKGRRLEAGDRVELPDPGEETAAPAAEGADAGPSVEVLLERADLVVVNKPAGLACQPLSEAERGTLVQRVGERFPEVLSAGPEALHAGLLHRLDVDTSGVVAIARSAEAFARLRPRFADVGVEKSYLAVVELAEVALEDRGEIRLPIARARARGGQMVAVKSGEERIRGAPMSACTRYRLVARGRDCALLLVQIERGRMHQIRVHLAATGHAIVGDQRYGRCAPDIGRQALHALALSFEHGAERIQVRASLPPDLLSLLAAREIDLDPAALELPAQS